MSDWCLYRSVIFKTWSGKHQNTSNGTIRGLEHMKILVLFFFIFFEEILRNLVSDIVAEEVEGDPTDDDLGTSYRIGGI